MAQTKRCFVQYELLPLKSVFLFLCFGKMIKVSLSYSRNKNSCRHENLFGNKETNPMWNVLCLKHKKGCETVASTRKNCEGNQQNYLCGFVLPVFAIWLQTTSQCQSHFTEEFKINSKWKMWKLLPHIIDVGCSNSPNSLIFPCDQIHTLLKI